MSQEKLGEAVGVTFQQVQKYEKGQNRIGASRLYDLSRILEVRVEFFFEGIDASAPQAVAGLSESAPAGFESAKGAGREAHDLLGAFQRITDTMLRRRLYDLAKAIGDGLSRR